MLDVSVDVLDVSEDKTTIRIHIANSHEKNGNACDSIEDLGIVKLPVVKKRRKQNYNNLNIDDYGDTQSSGNTLAKSGPGAINGSIHGICGKIFFIIFCMLNSQIVSQPKLIHGIFFLLESQFSKVGPSAFVLNTSYQVGG